MLRLLTVLTVLLVTPALGEAQRLERVWFGTSSRVIGGPNETGKSTLERVLPEGILKRGKQAAQDLRKGAEIKQHGRHQVGRARLLQPL